MTLSVILPTYFALVRQNTMLKYPESTPCPMSKTDQDTLNSTQSCKAMQQVAPRRRASTYFDSHVPHTGAVASRNMQQNQKIGRQGLNPEPLSRKSGAGLVPTARRRVSLLVAERTNGSLADRKSIRQGEIGQSDAHLRKKPRRRTIYVPSDDTTIFTIHPGLPYETTENTSLSLIADVQKGKKQVSNIADNVAMRSVGRRSLTAAPKRAPLQPSLKTLQEVVDPMDLFGQGQGKENIPPDASIVPESKSALSKVRGASIFAHNHQCSSLPPEMPLASRAMQQNPADRIPSQSNAHGQHHISADKSSKRLRGSITQKRNSIYYGTRVSKLMDDQARQGTAAKNGSQQSLSIKINEIRSPMEQFPLLQDDIDQAQMFEDAWLTDQETALTQLLNAFLETELPCVLSTSKQQEETRQTLMQIYQSPEDLLLYRRIRASLLYGAL